MDGVKSSALLENYDFPRETGVLDRISGPIAVTGRRTKMDFRSGRPTLPYQTVLTLQERRELHIVGARRHPESIGTERPEDNQMGVDRFT